MSMFEDFYTLLKRAGLPEDECKRIAGEAAQDAQVARAKERSEGDRVVEDEADIQMQREQAQEKLIRLIARRNGVNLETSHSVYFEGDNLTITLYEGEINLPELMGFVKELEANEVASHCAVGANSSNNVVLTFKVGL